MVKFNQALYVKEKESRFIAVETIQYQENYDDVINHLFCPDKNCDIKLSYARTREGGYLKKARGTEHSEQCIYVTGAVSEVSATYFIEMSGNLSNEGISRRKKNMGKKLKEFLNPPEKSEQKQSNNNRKKTKPKKANSDTEIEKAIKIKYDPNSVISKTDLQKSGVKTREPSFIPVLLHQVTERDSNKNLATVGIIEAIVLDREKSLADIHVTFNKTKAIFRLPPAFFSNSIRGVVKEQLLDYIEMLETYIQEKNKSIYINTMCQTHKIDINKIILYVYDPDFPSFSLVSNPDREFENLSSLAAAIVTKAI